MVLVRLIFPLLVFASIQCDELFTNTVPEDYYLRKDLTDCSDRFHEAYAYVPACGIAFGKKAHLAEFPHMAALGWPVPDRKWHSILWQCGGSLITERFVLTAAHCASDANNIPPRLVRLGDVDLASSAGDEYAQQFEIRQFIRHPKYSKNYFDLALVELNGWANIYSAVSIACLWPEQTLPADIFQTAGFGAIRFAGDPVPNLLKTNLYKMESAKCMKLYENSNRFRAHGIAPDQLCAFNPKSDTCQGDSGGPLQVILRSQWNFYAFVVAVTSFGSACGIGFPGVYQRVTPHIPWIESVVNQSMHHLICASKSTNVGNIGLLETTCNNQPAYYSSVWLSWPREAKGPQIPCSGTFIDYNTVVTSARCAQDLDGVQPNGIKLLERDDKPQAQIVEIQVHPEFDKTSLRNDLALLRLDKYLQPYNRVSASCIPVAKPSEICSERHTHDPVQCWELYVRNAKKKFNHYSCHSRGTQSVKLVWAKDTRKPPCEGFFINTDTVITSIRCMDSYSSDPPIEVEMIEPHQGIRMKIANILRHPGFNKIANTGFDTALLILSEEFLGICVRDARKSVTNVTLFPTFDVFASTSEELETLNIRSIRTCNESMVNSFTDQSGNSLANDPRYTCWDTEQGVVPGAVPLLPGAGLLDESNRFIRGVAAFKSSFGTVKPVISTNLSSYIDWITRFVLYRPENDDIAFQDDKDAFNLGSKCTLKNGTQGNCMPDYACRKVIVMYRNIQDIIVCGYEGNVGYVCCPPEFQSFPFST